MTRDETAFLKLGREVARMIRDIESVAKDDPGFARRKISFPGGEVYLVIVKDEALADLMDSAAQKAYEVHSVTPPSEVN